MGKIIWALVGILPLIILVDYLTRPPDIPIHVPEPRQEPQPRVDTERQRKLKQLSDIKKDVAEKEAELFLEESKQQAAEERASRLDPDEHLADPIIRPTGSLQASAYVCDHRHDYDRLDRALKTNQQDKVDALMRKDCRQTAFPQPAEIIVWDPDANKAQVLTASGNLLWTGTWNVSPD